MLIRQADMGLAFTSSPASSRNDDFRTSARLVSFRKLAFPKLAQRSVLYRVVADQQGVRIYLDLVALQHSRAQVAIVYGAGLSPPPAAEERRLAKVTATRMAKAMGGS